LSTWGAFQSSSWLSTKKTEKISLFHMQYFWPVHRRHNWIHRLITFLTGIISFFFSHSEIAGWKKNAHGKYRRVKKKHAHGKFRHRTWHKSSFFRRPIPPKKIQRQMGCKMTCYATLST
jgi:hypothetical protein